MVHWAGEGSDVILCLARDSPRSVPASINQPSSVYISYDYGNSFENKTEHFWLKGKGYASLEKFFIHPKYNSHVSKFYMMMWCGDDDDDVWVMLYSRECYICLAYEFQNIFCHVVYACCRGRDLPYYHVCSWIHLWIFMFFLCVECRQL